MYATSTEQQRGTRVRVLAEQLYRERYHYLLHIAVKNAAGEADAEEAVNDAFASFIRAFAPDSEAPPLAWLTLTLKRECWGKRRRRSLDRSADYEAVPDAGEAGCYPSSIPSRATETEQRVGDLDEARLRLSALKPAERRAIGMIAAGYSYKEVGEITGWTYTKVNRCASEGRARLRELALPIA
jgi:RNA polymerase sigma factor (sigma-70 family)